jgi:hypothetical protein
MHLLMAIVLRQTICMSENIQANFHINDSLLYVTRERYCLALYCPMLLCLYVFSV